MQARRQASARAAAVHRRASPRRLAACRSTGLLYSRGRRQPSV